MEKKSKTIVFFGNERLATGVATEAPTLRSLINAGYNIAGIVSNYAGTHSRNLRALEVAEIARQNNIPLWLPQKLSEIASELNRLNADIGVLAAYGKIIPQAIIDSFPYGIINIHPSLLPRHRGSTPIESVILEGASETGVSIMQLVKEMDAGPLYAQEKYAIPKGITKQQLADELLLIGSKLITKTLPGILEGLLVPKPQHSDTATYDSLIKKEDGHITWSKSATQIEREIRAYAIWPKSQAIIGGKNIVITEAKVTEETSNTPGKVSNQAGHLLIQCGEGMLEIQKLVPAGKKEMSAQAFLAGYGKLL
jgi:methionyl-tRNA formyltransferase